MTFQLMPNGIVRATGVVRDSTFRDLKDFASIHGLRDRKVVFDSNGGMVEVSMRIGRFLRANHVTATVGQVFFNGTISNTGRCSSMCPFIILGGVNRYIEEGNTLEVHQLWIPNDEKKPQDIYSAIEVFSIQRDIGKLVKYTWDMGGSGELIEIALSRSAAGDMRKMTLTEAKRVRLVNK